MRIICKRPADTGSHALGVCAYDIVGFRHHPAENNPCIVLTLPHGDLLKVTWPGEDRSGVLDRIVEALLSPSGVADCRKITQLKIELPKLAKHVVIDNSWANSVCHRGDLPCIAVVTV